MKKTSDLHVIRICLRSEHLRQVALSILRKMQQR